MPSATGTSELHAIAYDQMAQVQVVEDRVAKQFIRDLNRTIVAGVGNAVTAAADFGALTEAQAGWNRVVQQRFGPIFQRIYRKGSDYTIRLWRAAKGGDVPVGALGRAADEALQQGAREYLVGATNRLVATSDHVWASVRQGLSDGLTAGDNRAQLVTRVREGMSASESRADMIVRTEVNGANNAGALATGRGLEAAGVVAYKEWVATSDARTRPTHSEADGQRVPMGQHFIVGGAPLDHPGDPSGPAREVVQCRCAVIFTDKPPPAA